MQGYVRFSHLPILLASAPLAQMQNIYFEACSTGGGRAPTGRGGEGRGGEVRVPSEQDQILCLGNWEQASGIRGTIVGLSLIQTIKRDALQLSIPS